MKNVSFYFLLFFSLSAGAKSVDVVKEVIGVGETRNEAITNGLLDAVQQVKGVEVKTAEALKLELGSVVGKDGASTTSMIQSTEVITLNKAFGWVKSYKVLDANQQKDTGSWHVRLSVTVPQYQSIVAEDKRKTIAVMPFEVQPRNVVLGNRRYNAQDISRHLSDQLIVQLTQSGKFTILNRDFPSQIAAEKQLWQAGDVPSKAASRLGETLGADLMLLGKVYKFDVTDESENFYGSKTKTKNIDVDVYFNIIEPATEKIIWSNKKAFLSEHKINVFEEKEIDYVAIGLNETSSRIVIDVLDALFPIKMLDKVGDNTVLLSHGEPRLKNLDQLSIYQTVASVSDPDTTMNVKVAGKEIAVLEVVQVNSGYSLAKIIKGKIANVADEKTIIKVQADKPTPALTAPSPSLTPGSSDKPFKW